MAWGISTMKLATAFLLAALLLLLPSCAVAARPAPGKSADDGNIALLNMLQLPASVVGPESVAFDPNGVGPYSGVSDGRILRLNGNSWQTFAYGPGYSTVACKASKSRPSVVTESQCGRPLGLRFHLNSGTLYIADAYKGLMRVGPNGGKATVLVKKVDGVPLRFTNGVDVDQVTGEVYFSDSSTRFQRSQHERVTATGDSSGRLMRYDPRTGNVTVLQSGVTYPNGLSISTDRTHLIVSLTGPCKLMRYWIKGPKAGTSEIFTDLPGYPDNVRPDGKGGYWVALHREKTELPYGPNSHLLAVKINGDGKVVQEIRGTKNMRPTEVMERDGGKLYLGSVELDYVAVFKSLRT